MALQLAAIGIISFIAYLQQNSIMWLVAGGMSVFTGFYWYDTFVTNLGLAFGILFLVYGLACFSIAFTNMFTRIRAHFMEDDN